jgi:hypothetical protein
MEYNGGILSYIKRKTTINANDRISIKVAFADETTI